MAQYYYYCTVSGEWLGELWQNNNARVRIRTYVARLLQRAGARAQNIAARAYEPFWHGSHSDTLHSCKIIVMANSLLGWERFFEELTEFIRTCNRQSGTANQSFAEYALERIQTGIQSVSALLDRFESATPNSDDESTVLERYSTSLGELRSCLRELSREWQEHIDRCMQPCATSYAEGEDPNLILRKNNLSS